MSPKTHENLTKKQVVRRTISLSALSELEIVAQAAYLSKNCWKKDFQARCRRTSCLFVNISSGFKLFVNFSSDFKLFANFSNGFQLLGNFSGVLRLEALSPKLLFNDG